MDPLDRTDDLEAYGVHIETERQMNADAIPMQRDSIKSNFGPTIDDVSSAVTEERAIEVHDEPKNAEGAGAKQSMTDDIPAAANSVATDNFGNSAFKNPIDLDKNSLQWLRDTHNQTQARRAAAAAKSKEEAEATVETAGEAATPTKDEQFAPLRKILEDEIADREARKAAAATEERMHC